MTTYDWPSVLKIEDAGFNARGMTVSGPPSMTGRTQIASIDSGFWTATLKLSGLRSPQHVKVFRQLSALMEGGAHSLRVPACDIRQAPWAYSGGTPITAFSDVTFDDGSLFADGSEFYQQPITVTLAEDAALRDMAVTVDVALAGDITGGEYFSLGDRLYLIKQIVADGADDSPPTTLQTWSIWPSLRESWPAGTPLNMSRPVCRMRLATEGEMDAILRLMRFAQPTLNLVEAI